MFQMIVVKRVVISTALVFGCLSAVLSQQSSGTSLSTIAVVLVGDGEGNTIRIAPAVAIKSEGVFLVPLDVVREAKELQIRLQNGEIFDDVSLIGLDGRRNVATIRIRGVELKVADSPNADGLRPGEKLTVVTHLPGNLWSETKGSVTGAKMADEIAGAGQGFRVLQFEAELPGGIDGAVVLNGAGNPVALMTNEVVAPINSGVGIPIVSVKNLGDGGGTRSYGNGKALSLPTSVDSLKIARNPSKDPKDLLLSSKKIYVDSETSLFKQAQLITELKKRKEITELGWIFLEPGWESRNKADLVIELDHQVFTFDFTFTITHRRTSIVIASGKAIIADGASGSKKMGDQIIKSLSALTGIKPGK